MNYANFLNEGEPMSLPPPLPNAQPTWTSSQASPASDLYGSSASARSTQIGGSHYKDMAIQPIDFIQKNRLGFAEGNVVKYVSRWRAKGGVEDLRKARHYLDLLIAEETK